MRLSPFDTTKSSIPVTIITRPDAGHHADPDAAVLTLQPALHDHPPGSECVACAARGDIRALLFDLLTEMRQGRRKPFAAVTVDASALPDPQDVIDRLTPGKLPALGLRDHTVAKSFHLSNVI